MTCTKCQTQCTLKCHEVSKYHAIFRQSEDENVAPPSLSNREFFANILAMKPKKIMSNA